MNPFEHLVPEKNRAQFRQAVGLSTSSPTSQTDYGAFSHLVSGYQDQSQVITQNSPQQKPNYFERVAQDYRNTGNKITDSITKSGNQYQQGVQQANQSNSIGGQALGELKAVGGLLRGGLRTVGGVAEAAFSPITEAPRVKQVLDFIGKTIGNTEAGKKVANLVQKHPESSQDIMDAVNLLTLGGGKGIEKPVGEAVGSGLKRTGKALEESGLNSLESQKSSFVRDLIRPEQTKAVKEAQVARTTEKGTGIFKRSVIAPTPQELKIEQATKEIPGVSSKNTYQQNFNFIKSANEQEAKNLETTLKNNDFIFPKIELKARLNQIKQGLTENPSLIGDNEKIAEKLLNKFNMMLDGTPAKGSSLLQLRKDFDSWVQSQKGTKVYDPNTENAFSIVNRDLRQGINEFLDEKAVNVDVKNSLAKQSSLYRALDNIKPKAAKEADTAIGRAFQDMANAVGIKNKLVQQIGSVVGIGGLGAAAVFAPTAAVTGGLGFLAYKGGKLILKPQLRIGLGKLLETAGNVLSSDDRVLIKSLLQDENQSNLKLPTLVPQKIKSGIIGEQPLKSPLLENMYKKREKPISYIKNKDILPNNNISESPLPNLIPKPKNIVKGELSTAKKIPFMPKERQERLDIYLSKVLSNTGGADEATLIRQATKKFNEANPLPKKIPFLPKKKK